MCSVECSVERCAALQERLKEAAEELVRDEVMRALGRYEKREATILLSLQVEMDTGPKSKFLYAGLILKTCMIDHLLYTFAH